MQQASIDASALDRQIALRLRGLRNNQGWSLDDLAQRSGVSRATLSRLENGEVSPTASVLGKLCAAYGLTMSRLMYMMEEDFAPLMRAEAQPIWHDRETGFERRSVSPPASVLSGEVIACRLKPGTSIAYDGPSRPGLEHHLVMIEGELHVAANGHDYELRAGDCLRYRLFSASRFSTPPNSSAHYHLFIV
jgi:transcriptional regulator with XRE-family HTH domain